MMTEAEWAQLKERRLRSIRTSIETLRANEEPKLRNYRVGKLMGQINELRIVGLFTTDEARELSAATDEARRKAWEASPDVVQSDNA